MNLKEYKAKKMNDPEFVKAYEEIQPEMNVIRAIMLEFLRISHRRSWLREQGSLRLRLAS